MPPETLPLARYRYTFRLHQALQLPDYAGSLLRGQFGAALRSISCMTEQTSCAGCPLRASCPYAAVFEAPAPPQHDMQRFSHIPNPYVIEPPPLGTRSIAANNALTFNLVLFGRALEQVPLISFALQRAIEKGLGPERARGQLERIDIQQPAPANSSDAADWTPIWHQGDKELAAHDTAFPLPSADKLPAVTEARLTFLTPLRLQHQGQPVRPHALTPRKLIADLMRRITLLAEFHAGRPELVANARELVHHSEGLTHQQELRWHDWSRYSSRQKQEMTLGGALGSWALSGDLAPLLPWLHLGQWLHVGKNATLGLGAYRLDTLIPQH